MKITIEMLITKFRRPILVDNNSCWNWLGSISSQGYAIFNGKVVYGIIYSMQGKICQQDEILRHTCSNRKCVNPDHIIPGTHSDNMNDAVKYGSRGQGEKVYRKMVELKSRGWTQSMIACEIGVSRALVSQFFLGRLVNYKPSDFS